jgi:hypothetical protein
LKYNLNWWVASSRKTKRIKRGWSRKRTTQRKRKKLQRLSPHHWKRKRYVNKNKNLWNPPPHYQKPTKWCGDLSR